MNLVVSLLNKKGGVGKTSTCHHLSAALAKRGLRVLLVDADPQASLTQGMLGVAAGLSLPKEASIAALFDDSLFVDPTSLVVPTPFERISLVPGSDFLTPYNLPNADQAGPAQLILRDFLTEVGGGFDITLIDCPPNIQACSWVSLCASDGVLVPLQPEDYGAQGIASVQAAVRAVQQGANARLQLIGYLITMIQKRLGVHIAYEQMLRELYGEQVLATTVPHAAPFKEAILQRLPVGIYKPRVQAAKVMDQLAEELLARAAALFPTDGRRAA